MSHISVPESLVFRHTATRYTREGFSLEFEDELKTPNYRSAIVREYKLPFKSSDTENGAPTVSQSYLRKDPALLAV